MTHSTVPAHLFPLAWLLFATMAAPAWAASDPLTSGPEPVAEQAVLLSSDSLFFEWFGWSIATSGDTAVVGAFWGDGTIGDKGGAAYIFIRRGTSWFQEAKLPHSGQSYDLFGKSVAVSGDTVVVAAPNGHPDVPTSGAVYVFVRSGSTWSEQARFLAPDARERDGFGESVAISGDTIVVGAWGSDNTPLRQRTGAAYVFVRSGSTWSLQAKLLASDGSSDDLLGTTVAITGDTLIAGAVGYNQHQGAVYVFQRNGSSWSEQARLLASGREPHDNFGYALAISGDTAVVGAPFKPDGVSAAYVFVRNGSTWSEQARLGSHPGETWDMFGRSAAISGDMLIIGAGGPQYAFGAGYVFVRRGSSWTEYAQLQASGRNQADDSFGFSVAFADATALVGAPTAHDGQNGQYVGVVYAFSIPGVLVTPSRPFTIEGGGTAAFTVALGSEPTGDVVIDLASSNTEEGAVWPEQLTFATGDWSTPQTVTLTGVDDFVDDNGQPYMAALHMNQELTEDELYDGIDPEDVPAVNLEFAGDFYLVPACRVLDTRQPEQQPPLTSGVDRVVEFHNICGVPASARAVAINVTVVQPTGRGTLTLYPHDLPHPGPSTLPFFAKRARAGNATVLLATDGTGTLTVAPYVEGLGTVHLIIDVAGYFE